jgi:hypothetical protein
MRKGKMVSLSSNDLQRTNITENVSQYSYLRLFPKFQGIGKIVVENEKGNKPLSQINNNPFIEKYYGKCKNKQ